MSIDKSCRQLLTVFLWLACAGAPSVWADDPFADLVVAVPGEPTDGAVEWLYGARGGLTDLHSTLRSSLAPQVLATGDFNGDLQTDVVISPTYQFTVWYGSADPLDPFSGPSRTYTAYELLPETFPENVPTEIGAALATGDFDADGFDDLAIGVPNDTLRGSVLVLYGSPAGVLLPLQQLRQGADGLVGEDLDAEQFGAALATGDFDNDGFSDLAIGMPEASPAAIHLVYGGPAGLSAVGNAQLTAEDVLGAPDGTTATFFGFSLAAGDVNGDGFDDLAIGAPGDHRVVVNGGMVAVALGGASGIVSGNPSVRLEQGTALIGDEPEMDDDLGTSVEMGDFDGDGFADLAIGVRGEDLSESQVNAGVVHVLYGSAAGFVVISSQTWHQGGELQGGPEAGDLFGDGLAAGDFDADGFDDLAISAPRENVYPIDRAGAVSVIYGSNAGLTGDGDQLWHQNALDLVGSCETDDRFGEAVIALASRGVFADSFEGGTTDAWEGEVRIWRCDGLLYGSGDGCHCGCGTRDPDCLGAGADACDVCTSAGSCAESMTCSVIDFADNAICW